MLYGVTFVKAVQPQKKEAFVKFVLLCKNVESKSKCVIQIRIQNKKVSIVNQ